MKIIFPEITNNNIAKEATSHFNDIEFLSTDSLDQAVELLKTGQADSLIAGIDYSTRDVILALKDQIPLKSNCFSSCFICQKEQQTIAIADGGVVKHPDQAQLYTIIEDTAKTFQAFTGNQPRIALLSYSTKGSGAKDSSEFQDYYDCIQEITNHHPNWLIDGEMQLDCAINPRIADKKAPDSILKGQANILITPDLNSGNILYKSLEQFGGFHIAGPILQGFKIPLADLSRGSTVEDIILTIKVIRNQL